MTPAAAIGVGAVRVYQWTLRPFIGPHCRFWPSCSDYAIEALCLHGALKGSGLAAKRVLRCNPWHAGGIDLVPAATGASTGTGPGSVKPVRGHSERTADRRDIRQMGH